MKLQTEMIFPKPHWDRGERTLDRLVKDQGMS